MLVVLGCVGCAFGAPGDALRELDVENLAYVDGFFADTTGSAIAVAAYWFTELHIDN